MEGVVLDYLKNDNIIIEVIPSYELYSYFSEDKNQYAPDTHTNMITIYQNLMDEYVIK